jgi:hypothetical protein
MHLSVKPIHTAKAKIWVDEPGVLCMQPNKGVELNLEDVKEYFRICREYLRGSGKTVQLMYGLNDFTMSKEAREYIADHAAELFLASAMITHNLAIRLIVTFFDRFHKSEVPFKSFETVEDAREWLLTFKN